MLSRPPALSTLAAQSQKTSVAFEETPTEHQAGRASNGFSCVHRALATGPIHAASPPWQCTALSAARGGGGAEGGAEPPHSCLRERLSSAWSRTASHPLRSKRCAKPLRSSVASRADAAAADLRRAASGPLGVPTSAEGASGTAALIAEDTSEGKSRMQ